MALLGGCIDEDVVRCADGTLCPAGFACFVPTEGPPSCQRAESFEVCSELHEGDTCTVPGSFTGACYQDVCLEIACGNRIVQPGEGCDDGNLTSGDGCDGRCLSDETCGNGYRDPGEACDAGAANADTPDATCRTTCLGPACGDGVTDPGRGETCDDGNQVPGDGCTFACIVESCGNGIVDFFAGEQCDDGEAANSDAPDAHCRPTCLFPSCGDGVRDPGRDEACDDGVDANSELPNATCRTDCQARRCGDGVADDGFSEACDDANNSSGDGCRGDCLSDETCGNGVVDAFTGEVCDDGNGWRHDGCSGCLAEDLTWLDATATTGPATSHCAAYDPQRKVWVAFGGARGSGYPSETWELHNTTWRRRSPTVSPPGRADCGLAYDVARGRLVLHGGAGDTGFQRSDTWEWDGETWIEAPPGGPISYYTTNVYLGARHALWEYGRRDSAAVWEWNGTTWDYVGEGPPARTQPALAYDPVRDQVVMFGGRTEDNPVGHRNDTWIWDGTTWTQRFPTTVPAAAFSGVGWYSTRYQQVMMHLGDGNVWGWDGSDWHATPVSLNLGVRSWARHIYIDDDVAIVDGVPYDLDLGTTQGWHPRTVVMTAPLRPGAAGAWNDSSAQYEMFGGTNGAETDDFYVRRQGEWSKVTPAGGAPWPAPRVAHAMAYDPLRHRTVLMGGATGGVVRNDLWEWDGVAWTELAPSGAWPTAGRDSAMTFAPTLGEVLLIGGRASTGSDVRADVWSWNGTAWTRRADLPQPLAALSPAWDRDRDVLVLYGGFDPSWAGKRMQWTFEWTPDMWQWSAYSAQETPMRYFAAAVYDPMRRRVVLHGGSGFGSVLSDTWEWEPAAFAWRQISGSGPRTSGLQAFYDTDASEMIALSNAGGALGEWRMRRDSPLPEESCAIGNDADADGREACDDPDCWWTCTPSCPPESSCDPALPACGDGRCDPVESCDRCATDCGACATVCGDNVCGGAEAAASCPGDCTP